MNVLIPYHEKIDPEPAIKYASGLNVETEIFHVIRENGTQDVEKNVQEQIKNANAGNNFNISQKDGLIFNELKEKINDFDLIVMVTRSEENIDKTLGSITSHLVDFTSKDVLILPEDYQYKPPKKGVVIGEFHVYRHDFLSPKLEMLQNNFNELKFDGIHFTNETAEQPDQLIEIPNTKKYGLDEFPGILFRDDLQLDQYDLLLFAFSGRGLMQNTIFPGNLARKLALKTGKPIWVSNE